MSIKHRYRFENNSNDEYGSAGGQLISGAAYTASYKKEGSYGLSTDTGANEGFETGTLSLPSRFTVSIWRLKWGGSGQASILDSFDIDDDGFQINYDYSNSRIEVKTGDGTTTDTIVSSTLSSPSGSWTHYAVALDSSVGTAKIYVNGVDQTSTDVSCNIGFALDNKVIVGFNSWSYLDDFQIYDEYLNEAAAKWLYDNPGGVIGVVDGSSNGKSAVTANIGQAGATEYIDGSANGSTSLNTTLKGTGDIGGETNGDSTWQLVLLGKGSVSGVANSSTTLETELKGYGNLAGSGSGLSTLTGNCLGSGSLSGNVNVSTTLSASLNIGENIEIISGETSGSSNLDLSLVGVGDVAGTISCDTIVNSSLHGKGEIIGICNSIAGLSASLDGTGTIAGIIPTNSSLTINLHGKGFLHGLTTGATNLRSLVVNGTGRRSISGISRPAYTIYENVYLQQSIEGNIQTQDISGMLRRTV